MAVLYGRFFEQQRVQDPYARDTEIAAEIAEAFEAFWAEIALAYKDAPKVAPGEG